MENPVFSKFPKFVNVRFCLFVFCSQIVATLEKPSSFQCFHIFNEIRMCKLAWLVPMLVFFNNRISLHVRFVAPMIRFLNETNLRRHSAVQKYKHRTQRKEITKTLAWVQAKRTCNENRLLKNVRIGTHETNMQRN